MSQFITYRDNAGVYVELPTGIELVNIEFTEQAEEGSVGITTVPVEDASVSFEVAGHRGFAVHETDVSSGEDAIFRGYTADREYVPLNGVSPTGRVVNLSIADLNSVFGRRVMVGNDCKRPAETDVERIQWLVTTAEAGLIMDTSLLSTTSPVHMDKVDYTGAMMDQVFDDCAQASGKNWAMTYDFVTSNGYQLWYGKDELTTYDSGCLLTNHPSLVDDVNDTGATVFAISNDTRIQIDPSRVYSGVLGRWAKGMVYRQRAATAHAFARRDVVMDMPFVKTKTKAIARVKRYLASLDEEDVRIETTIWVAAKNVNKVRLLHRVQFQSTMAAETLTPIYCRVVKRTVSYFVDGFYRVQLTLVGGATAAAPCDGGVEEALTATALGSSVLFEWATQPTVGQYVVSLLTGRAQDPDSGHVPIAIAVDDMPIVGTEWDYDGSEQASADTSSIEAASKVCTADDTTRFSWQSLDGTARPVAIALKFTGATGVEGPYSDSGTDDLDMGVSGITVSEPGVLVFMFTIHNFDQVPHVMTAPSGDGITLMVNGYARYGSPTIDWVSAGYQSITTPGTYSLAWHVSNTFSDWDWEALAVFVPGAACPEDA